jgi:hypothetical protein
LWRRLYIARPLAELLPGLVNPRDGRTLLQIAEELHCGGCAILHPKLNLLDG